MIDISIVDPGLESRTLSNVSEFWEKAIFLMISQHREAEASPYDILLPSETEKS
jgi:hypothetical protein